MKNMDAFFHPQTAVVIGASNTKGTVGYTIFQNMKKAEIKKAIPVNPRHKTVQGKKSYASITEVDEHIDLAVIAVPSKAVPQALEECMAKKTKAAIIISAGFSEVGERKNTQKIGELIRKNPGTLVMGPNCVGVLNAHNGVDTTFFERTRSTEPKKGTLAFISQSGALGSMILDWVGTQRIGVSKFASYGNAMGVDEADLIEYFGNDRETKVITVYIEGAKHGRKFYTVAKKVSRKKPIIVLKGGKHEQTRAAAASHTGSLAGASKVYEAVFSQAGIIQADDLLDLFSMAKLMEQEPLPKGKRVQIITNGGGFGIIAADQVIAGGLGLAKLSRKTVRKLKTRMPRAIISNPIDLLGDADHKMYDAAIRACMDDKNVDIIVTLFLFTLPTLDAGKLALVKKPKTRITKPVIAIAVGSEYTKKYLKKIEKAGFTTFNYPSVAARALRGMALYSEYLGKS